MVPRTRASSPGRKPTSGMLSRLASTSGVVVLGEGAALRVVALARGSPRAPGRAARASGRPDRRARAPRPPCTARSKATQTITREWVKWRSGPRISQSPLSGSSQCSASSSTSDALQRPALRRLLEPAVAGVLEGDHHLAEHVGLALGHRAVADAHRAGVGVAGQVVELALGELAAAVDGVHDLQVRRVARDRAQQPVAPLVAPRRCSRRPSSDSRVSAASRSQQKR